MVGFFLRAKGNRNRDRVKTLADDIAPREKGKFNVQTTDYNFQGVKQYWIKRKKWLVE